MPGCIQAIEWYLADIFSYSNGAHIVDSLQKARKYDIYINTNNEDSYKLMHNKIVTKSFCGECNNRKENLLCGYISVTAIMASTK